MVAKKTVPLEDVECLDFVSWLKREAPDVKFAHIANEARSNRRDAVIRGAKLKKMGQSRGVWDYELFVPVYDVDNELADYQEIRIEMKRQRGGGSTTSPEQRKWGKVYDIAGIPHKVCFGADEAIDFVKLFYRKKSRHDYDVF